MGRVGKLIGFARATSDGALTATIWDVAVNAYRPQNLWACTLPVDVDLCCATGPHLLRYIGELCHASS